MILGAARQLQPGRGPRRRGQRQDLARRRAGPPAQPGGQAGRAAPATRVVSPPGCERRVAALPRKERPAYVGTFHNLGVEWGAPTGREDDSNFWEVELPELMVGPRRASSRSGRLFDADRRRRGAGLRRPVVAGRAGGAEGRGRRRALRVLRRGAAGVLPVRRAAGRAGPARARPEPPQHPADRGELLDAGADPDAPRGRRRAGDHASSSARAERGARRGRGPGRRTPRRRAGGPRTSPCSPPAAGTRSRRRGRRPGRRSYWDTFWDQEQVFYGHVLGFKGLERPAVILALNETRAGRAVPGAAVRRAVPGARPARRGGGPGVRGGGRRRGGAAAPAGALTHASVQGHVRHRGVTGSPHVGHWTSSTGAGGLALGAAVLADPVHAAHRGRGGGSGAQLG